MSIANYFDQVQLSLAHLYSNLFIATLFSIFLLVATILDMKYLKIPNKLNGLFFIIRFVLIPWMSFSLFDLLGAVIAFIALLIPAMVKNTKMGGDIKMAGVIGLYTGIYLTPIFLMTACVYFLLYTNLMYYGITKRMIPFAPFFFLANITLMIVYYVCM